MSTSSIVASQLFMQNAMRIAQNRKDAVEAVVESDANVVIAMFTLFGVIAVGLIIFMIIMIWRNK